MIVPPGVARANQVFVLCLWGKCAAMSLRPPLPLPWPLPLPLPLPWLAQAKPGSVAEPALHAKTVRPCANARDPRRKSRMKPIQKRRRPMQQASSEAPRALQPYFRAFPAIRFDHARAFRTV